MTNLDIIKYLAYENPSRLAELLDDIYCNAWNCGSCAASTGKIVEECEIDNFNEWLYEDASKRGYYYDDELKEWHKAINPVYLIDFGSGKLECKDGKLSMQSGDCNIVIDQAIDELKLLENVIEATKHDDSDYVRFRQSVCAYCYDPNCMRSQVEICDCHKFRSYYKLEKEN